LLIFIDTVAHMFDFNNNSNMKPSLIVHFFSFALIINKRGREKQIEHHHEATIEQRHGNYMTNYVGEKQERVK